MSTVAGPVLVGSPRWFRVLLCRPASNQRMIEVDVDALGGDREVMEHIGISAVVHEPAGHRDEGAERRSERADSSRRIELEHRAIMRG